MARRYRYEYLMKKKAKEQAKKERQDSMTEKQKELREVLGWILYILIVVLATYLIVTYVGQRTKVSGDSMEATLQDGDNLIVDKISYRFRDPKRFEVIVFPYRYADNTYYIKRIIGLPGETIQIIDGYVYINGELLEENFGLEVMNSAGSAANPIELGDDEYFVLGDNRNNSEDSRSGNIGTVHADAIEGKAWFHLKCEHSEMGMIE